MNTLKTETVLFDKIYTYEELYDLTEDVEDALSEEYNKIVAKLPKDKHQFVTGSFHISIKWIPDAITE